MRYTKEQSAFAHFFTASVWSSPLWLAVRLYLAWIWLEAGWEKLHNPAWIGVARGQAIMGFGQNALAQTNGAHPNVQAWYAVFLQHTILAQPMLWSYLIVYGELLVGVGLLLGCVVGVTAFFGFLMNLNFMLAGSVSVNPIMLLLAIGLMLAWRVAGYIGGDYVILPLLARWRGAGQGALLGGEPQRS